MLHGKTISGLKRRMLHGKTIKRQKIADIYPSDKASHYQRYLYPSACHVWYQCRNAPSGNEGHEKKNEKLMNKLINIHPYLRVQHPAHLHNPYLSHLYSQHPAHLHNPYPDPYRTQHQRHS